MYKTVVVKIQCSVNFDVAVSCYMTSDMKMNDGSGCMPRYVFNGFLMVMTSQWESISISQNEWNESLNNEADV